MREARTFVVYMVPAVIKLTARQFFFLRKAPSAKSLDPQFALFVDSDQHKETGQSLSSSMLLQDSRCEDVCS
jgi:hypothetical protein